MKHISPGMAVPGFTSSNPNVSPCIVDGFRTRHTPWPAQPRY
ncbi:hypothetical protein [Pseudoduganella lutea]|nr:hypothetical protein [Pseudoduganella lutea]